MKIYSLLRRGNQHKDFCEDFVMNFSLERHWVGVVADGCSSGKASHFASNLVCKIIRQILNQHGKIFTQNTDIQLIGKKILLLFIENLAKTQTFLTIPEEELLATVLLAIHDYERKETFIGVLGDGVVVCDEEIHIYDHDNAPDYPAQHLANPESWKSYCESQILVKKNLQNLAISTDGILQFRPYKTIVTHDTETLSVDPLNFLLNNDFLAQNSNMLSRKANILDTQYGLLPMDDLGILRVIFGV